MSVDVDAGELMGFNEYARHRGCAANAVTKAEKDGRIAAAVVRSESGEFIGIKWRLADELWARHTDPLEAAKNGKLNLPPAPAPIAAPDPEQASLPMTGDDTEAPLPASAGSDHGYFRARADRERFQAERARLDLMERLGVLVSTQQVRDETFAVFRQLRDNLFLIGPRVSQRFAAETDPLRIEQLLNEQHRAVLNELSRALALDAAGGDGARPEPDL